MEKTDGSFSGMEFKKKKVFLILLPNQLIMRVEWRPKRCVSGTFAKSLDCDIGGGGSAYERQTGSIQYGQSNFGTRSRVRTQAFL